jgi:hypothetical protein
MSPRNLSLLVNMNTYPHVSTIPYSASAAATEGVGEGRDGVRAGVPAAERSAGLVPAPQRPCLEGHLRRYVSHCMFRDCTEYVCVWIRMDLSWNCVLYLNKYLHSQVSLLHLHVSRAAQGRAPRTQEDPTASRLAPSARSCSPPLYRSSSPLPMPARYSHFRCLHHFHCRCHRRFVVFSISLSRFVQ